MDDDLKLRIGANPLQLPFGNPTKVGRQLTFTKGPSLQFS